MLNIIVYEDNETFMEKNVVAINKALASIDIDYRIYKYSHFTNGLNELVCNRDIKKIFVLDIESKDFSGLEVAARIREEDFESIIIFATAYTKYQDDIFYSRLMVLDFVSKYNGYEERLKDDIIAAVKIIYYKKTFNFTYNHTVYRVLYDNICFIEKEPLIKRCIIHTLKSDFYISKSINWLEKNLGGPFIKTHQSCIVNINNIKNIIYGRNQIIFKNGLKTCLLTDKSKKEVKDRVTSIY